MTIRVKLPTGQIGEFPDDMSHEQIEAVLQKQFPPTGQSQIPETPFNGRPTPEPEQTGLAGLASDAADMFSNALTAGGNFLEKTPENLRKIHKDLAENPMNGPAHVLGQLGASTAELAKSTINSPSDFAKYLIKKNLAFDLPAIPGFKNKINYGALGLLPQPPEPKTMSEQIPHIPEDTGLEKALGTEANPEKGDEFTRALVPIIAAGAGGVSGGKSLYNLIAKPAKNILKTRKLEAQISDAADAMGLSKAKTQKLKEVLREKFSEEHGKKIGELTPTGQKVEVNVKKNAIGELAPDLAIPKKEVGEIPPEPVAKVRETTPEPSLQDTTTAAIKASEEANKDLQTELGVKNEPMRHGGEKVQAAIEHVKKTAHDLYNSARKFFVEKNVKADNGAEIKSATAELTKLKDSDELAPGYGHGSEEQKALESNIASLEGAQVKASDVFDLQQHMVKLSKRYRDKMHGKDLSQLERDRYENISNKLMGHADKLAKRLESIGGDEPQAMIKEANKGWRTYSQVKQNKIGKVAYKQGKLPASALTDITYNADGNKFLTSLTETIPDLKKNMLAAFVGESNFGKILDPNAVTQRYLNSLPVVQDKLTAFKNSMRAVKQAERADKAANAAAKAEHKEVNAKAAADLKEANTKALDDFKALKKSMTDEAERQAKLQKAEKAHDALQAEIKSHKAAIPKLEARMKEEDITVAEHAKLEKELKAHKDAIADKSPRLKNMMSAILKLTGGASLAHKFGIH